MSEKRIGVCNLCEAICGLELTVEGREVVSVRGNADDPLSRGHICPKGVAIADVYADPDRLRRPVKRVVATVAAAGWRSAGTRRSTWSPTTWHASSTSTAATRSASTSATPTPTASGR